MNMTFNMIDSIIGDIKYKDWKFNIIARKDCYVLKITFEAPDINTGKMQTQHCRKWFISHHACRAEVVRTAWKAVLAAEEHEAGELFQYKGVRIHSPHLDPYMVACIIEEEGEANMLEKRTEPVNVESST